MAHGEQRAAISGPHARGTGTQRPTEAKKALAARRGRENVREERPNISPAVAGTIAPAKHLSRMNPYGALRVIDRLAI